VSTYPEFTKMNGTGNDFVIFNNTQGALCFTQRKRQALCRRGFSIGGDGLILIEKPRVKNAHFRMRYFNANGKEASMCGNGARCAARYAFENKIAPRKMIFETGAGLQHAQVMASGGVRLFMTPPKILNNKLTLALTAPGKSFTGLFANTGVPHFVTPVKNLATLPVNELAPTLRHHKKFGAAGANINFVALQKTGVVSIRTYERGVEAETLACGTGAVAAALWAHLVHKLPSPVAVKARGGLLKISFSYAKNAFSNIVLEGPTAIVFTGKLGLNALG
jgi:diaminopimelate epimerase